MMMIELAERLTELADRCEKASGRQEDGGYGLDSDIARAFGWTYHLREETHSWQWQHPTNPLHKQASPPRYTSSLDAAMTLVPEGMQGQVQSGNRPGAWVGTEGGDAPDFNVAATPALALCAASLRSRAAQPLEKSGD